MDKQKHANESSAQARRLSGRANYVLIGAVIAVLAIIAIVNLKDNQPIASPPIDAQAVKPASEQLQEQPQPVRVGTVIPNIIMQSPEPPLTALDLKEQADLTDEDCSKMAVGTWVSEDDGERKLTIRSDGSATMVYKPSQLKQLLLGEKVTIEISWKIKDHTVTFHSNSGVPATSFKTITTIYGRKMDRKILLLNAESFTLQDPKDMHKSEWKRIAQP